jgi:hypothetical protein
MSNTNYLVHIQHSLRLLMEQQIPNKKRFNIIGYLFTFYKNFYQIYHNNFKRFGRSIKRWKPTVVKPTHALLQDAWKWVLDLTCEGTHNVIYVITYGNY